MVKQLRILQIGAGSMGTRRLRDLSQRPDVLLSVLDERDDRRQRSVKLFGVQSLKTLDEAISWRPDVLSISTPPDRHDEYISFALENGLHHFCEAQLWTYDFSRVEKESQNRGVVSAASCSLHFLPVIKKLQQLVNERLGDLHAYQMSLSTYMPSWHPEEGMEYYARHRDTAAGREMVPFELLYLNDVFGFPAEVTSSVGRRGQLDNDPKCEDTWCLQMDLTGGAFGQLMVLQGSPTTIRKGYCFGTKGRIEFDIFNGVIVAEFEDEDEKTINCGSQKDTIEQAYKDEIDTFVETILGKAKWPLSYYGSAVASATIAAAEKSAINGKREKVDPEIQPGHLPGTTTICQSV